MSNLTRWEPVREMMTLRLRSICTRPTTML
jgi:hypothetical protein